MFGEVIRHVHLVLVPRGKDVPAEHRSAALIINQGTYVDRGGSLEAGARIREALQVQSSPQH